VGRQQALAAFRKAGGEGLLGHAPGQDYRPIDSTTRLQSDCVWKMK
jgi:hypothetical protein